jgi:hypothetical protein
VVIQIKGTRLNPYVFRHALLGPLGECSQSRNCHVREQADPRTGSYSSACPAYDSAASSSRNLSSASLSTCRAL